MQIKELNAETSYVIDSVAPKMSGKDIGLLHHKYRASTRQRHRFCFHQNPSVDLHDIIICYDRHSYIPPNKHVGKVESLIVLAGELDFFLFNDSGQVYDYRRLSTAGSGKPFYLRVPPNTWHGLRAVGEEPCVIKETIAGPYDRSTLQWASFAPSEVDGAETGFQWYDDIMQQCALRHIATPPEEVFERVSDTVFRSSRQLVTVSQRQLQPIVDAACEAPSKRARLCCHGGSEEKLQEMFIALARGVEIEESVHLRKDESLTVINGFGTYAFPNEDGSMRDITTLAPCETNSPHDKLFFFARINRYVPHKINITSNCMLIHEATTGPFIKSDTDYRLKIL